MMESVEYDGKEGWKVVKTIKGRLKWYRCNLRLLGKLIRLGHTAVASTSFGASKHLRVSERKTKTTNSEEIERGKESEPTQTCAMVLVAKANVRCGNLATSNGLQDSRITFFVYLSNSRRQEPG